MIREGVQTISADGKLLPGWRHEQSAAWRVQANEAMEESAMVVKNASAAAIELKALNKRCRELMRLIKSGKASDAEIKEFSAMPREIGPARGKSLDVILAIKASKTAV